MLGRLVIAFILCLATPALAEPYCIDASGPKQHITDKHGQWTILTKDQRLFLAGIYAMNPQTPPGLPYGDQAALIQLEGQQSGLIFFLDGNLACTPMAIPKELIDMLMALDQIKHEGNGT